MTFIVDILTSVEFWKIAAPAFFATIAWFVNEHRKRVWEKWQIKKEACTKALNIANAVISNYQYSNIDPSKMKPQKESIENVRACFNELACCCDNLEVIETLKYIVLDKKANPGDIVKLRTAVRKELKFGKEAIDTDDKTAFIGSINCDPKP